MRRGSWLLERYLGRTILAYLLLALLFLTGALVTQQAGRLLETVKASDAAGSALLNILAALLPTLVTLTLPMAVLLATLIGLSQLGGESELIALQAMGQGRGVVARPVLLLGLVATGLAFYLNLAVIPQAASLLREIALRTAQYKLESPVEPHTFNTDVPQYVFYIREGDNQTGTWRNVFIYQQTADGLERLITAEQGRLDFAGSGRADMPSELFLSDVWMLSGKREKETGPAGEIAWTTDRGGQTRLTFPTGRREVLQKLETRPLELDELSWSELRAKGQASGVAPAERRTALVLAQKKLALSVLPLTLAWLGLGLGLRVRRGGRGVGLVWGFIALTGYYLLALVGEQMARKGTLGPVAGVWGAQLLALLAGAGSLWWSEQPLPYVAQLPRLIRLGRNKLSRVIKPLKPFAKPWAEVSDRLLKPNKLNHLRTKQTAQDSPSDNQEHLTSSSLNLPTPAAPTNPQRSWGGPTFLDRSVIISLLSVGLFTLLTLLLLLLTFTLFELWRFIVPGKEGYWLIGQYLVYLMPLFLVQTVAGAGLIATLATYALMARRSEAIVWWASGQSTYRLLAPALFCALVLGGGTWYVQEYIMPEANLRQDELRAQIKGTPKINTKARQWVAPLNTTTIYNYEYDETREALRDLQIFSFAPGKSRLQEWLKAKNAWWITPAELKLEQVEKWEIKDDGRVQRSVLAEVSLPVPVGAESFKPSLRKATQLSAAELTRLIETARGRGEEVQGWATALHFKYALPFNTALLMLAGVPLALGFDRRRVLAGLGLAILLSLVFWMLSGLLQQLGTRGLLPALVAGWLPTICCAGLFGYLLSRTRT